MDTLVIIPARAGSKGIPNKNMKALGGKPLIAYTLQAAQDVFSADQICVSTDSQEIIDFVQSKGIKVPFIRPAELATDTASTRSVILHALDFYKIERQVTPKTIVLLQPTSPFRTGTHIKDALNLFSDKLDMVVSVTAAQSNPYFTLFEENEKGFLEKSKKSTAIRRQDVPSVWEFNGAVYVFKTSSVIDQELSQFGQIKKYEMDAESSVDLDTDMDWVVAEYVLSKK